MGYEILIKNNGEFYKPIIEGQIKIKRSRKFEPSTATFNVVKDEVIDYQEGNPVRISKDGKVIFYGYVFDKERTGDQIIKTKCYDQLIYLKNKDTYQYEDKTYGELLKMICSDRHLEAGTIEDTKYKIPMRTEREKEYFTILETASDLTLTHTGKEFVLFDEAGKICLKEWESLKTEEIINYDVAQDFDYKTTINNLYNRIKINYIDDETQEVTTIIVEDKDSIEKHGILQFYAETSTKENIEEKAKILLNLLNRKGRALKIKGAFGNWDVRGGSLIPVHFEGLGDIHVNSMMLVDEVEHTADEVQHFMDLKVFNKDIMPDFTGQGAFEGAKQKQKSPETSNYSGGKYTAGNPGSAGRAAVLGFAEKQLGKKYSQANRMAANSFDCSSLVLRSMRAAGLDTTGAGLTTRTIAGDKRFVEIQKKDLQPGDILWVKGHVAIFEKGNTTIEAMNPRKGVRRGTVGNRFTRFYRIKGIDK